MVNSVGAAGRMIGPVLGGLIVDVFNMELLFFTLLALLFIPYITTFAYDRGIAGERKTE